MVVAEVVMELVVTLIFDTIGGAAMDGLAGRSRRGKEARELVHLAAIDKLDAQQEARLRELLSARGHAVDELSHDELVEVARRYEKRFGDARKATRARAKR